MDEWLEAVRTLLIRRYGIDLGDIGVTEKEPPEFWKDETPDEFVERVGEKYDLTELRR